MKYRIVITNVLGYRIAELQKGRWLFWVTIKYCRQDESIHDFVLRCKRQFPNKILYGIERSLNF